MDAILQIVEVLLLPEAEVNLITEVLQLTNNERAQAGLDPLTLDLQLSQAAYNHSVDMAHHDYFGHTGSDGSASWNRITAAGYEYQTAAENIAAGYPTAATVFQAWMNSPEHRSNILNPNFDHVGIGYYKYDNDTGVNNFYRYWTQDFGARLPGSTPPELAPQEPQASQPALVEPAPPENSAPQPTSIEPSPPETPIAQPTQSEASESANLNPESAQPEPSEASANLNPVSTPAGPSEVSANLNPKSALAKPSKVRANLTPQMKQLSVEGSPNTPDNLSGDGSNRAQKTPEDSNRPAIPINEDGSDNEISSNSENEILAGIRELETRIIEAAAENRAQTSSENSDRPAIPIDGSDSDDEILGGSDHEIIMAAAGDDLVAGGLGDDQIFGEAGDDVLRGDDNRRASGGTIGGDDIIFGGQGDDRIGGKGGNDFLLGGAGDDRIWGDDGDDLLWGGLGDDILVGDDSSSGSGQDIFVLAVGGGTDTLKDFQVGVDLIGLAYDLNFGSLSVISNGDDTLIKVHESFLAVVNGVSAAELSSSAFTAV
ncbi:MAG: CAP domain-containing protein [Leptolyngbyaceae cyanobacterium MO_188.B28]|nr:CAP domain-containing protein [Leptolyngbyaceae cyanobacterium MO_188.B28]